MINSRIWNKKPGFVAGATGTVLFANFGSLNEDDIA